MLVLKFNHVSKGGAYFQAGMNSQCAVVGGGGGGGGFKNTLELLNLRALKISPVNKIHIFQCLDKIFCVEFQRYPLKFHKNILPKHWKMWLLYNIEILRAHRFKSSYVFLKCSQFLYLQCTFDIPKELTKYNPYSLPVWMSYVLQFKIPLRWRHNGRENVWNHQPHHCLLRLLFRRRSKKTSKLRITGLCAGNSPGTGEFPAHVSSNAENVSIWWRHHAKPGQRSGFVSSVLNATQQC